MYNDDYINTDGNFVHITAIVGNNVIMGRGNVIMPYAVIGQPGFIRGMKEYFGKVVMGDNNRVGCHASVMSGKEGVTQIGDGNLIMNYANIGHDVKVGDKCEIGTGVIICGHAEVESESKINAGTVIRNRVKVRKSLIGIGSVVTKDVEENTIIYGNPAK